MLKNSVRVDYTFYPRIMGNKIVGFECHFYAGEKAHTALS